MQTDINYSLLVDQPGNYISGEDITELLHDANVPQDIIDEVADNLTVVDWDGDMAKRWAIYLPSGMHRLNDYDMAAVVKEVVAWRGVPQDALKVLAGLERDRRERIKECDRRIVEECRRLTGLDIPQPCEWL